MGEMGYVLAQCVDEITEDQFNFGVSSLEPVFDLCDYKTSRPENERLSTNSYNGFAKIDCFSYAHITVADYVFANYNDLYV